MQETFHRTATVKPGGRIELVNPALRSGEIVQVTVRHKIPVEGRSIVDVLAKAPGHRIFKTAEDVRAYMDEEKAAWDR